MAIDSYPRNLTGYGEHPPDPRWPGGARIAVNIVINYEEGAERTILNGDGQSETRLSDLYNPAPRIGLRDQNMESAYDFGSRVGVWRLLKILRRYDLPYTVYAVGRALELNPAVAEAFGRGNCDMVNHCYRWIDHSLMAEDTERQQIAHGTDVITRTTGKRPRGFYAGMPSPNTRRLIMAAGYDYDSDDYSDEIPFWVDLGGSPFLVLPASLNNGDTRFARGHGFNFARDYFTVLKDTFDWFYDEADRDLGPRMMSLGLHSRLIGHPSRIAGLTRTLDYMLTKPDVWFCRREEIADHWRRTHPPAGRPAHPTATGG
ncbi:MAG: polysaccharide deacetylase family protein [Alphaproteobacteria bacterium]